MSGDLSKLELCEGISVHVPGFVYFDVPIGKNPDKRDYIVSNARIEATGFKPECSLNRGIEELVRGYHMLCNSRYVNV